MIESLNKIKELYNKNQNLMEYMRNQKGNEKNSLEDVLISYDFQAGSYTQGYKKKPEVRLKYGSYIANNIDNLGCFDSIVEIGVGEATTLGPVLLSMKHKPMNCYGFDVSWSRIKYAQHFLNKIGIESVHLFTGNLFCAPLKDNSIDVVYTSHSLEPNGGREKEALMEAYRIARDYIVLLEPAYELANREAQDRMRKHGYVTNLLSTARQLGYHILEYKLFDFSLNPLNPTGIMIIEKRTSDNKPINPMCCPITNEDIVRDKNALFSPNALLAYPILDDIPCLLPQNAIIATKFEESIGL